MMHSCVYVYDVCTYYNAINFCKQEENYCRLRYKHAHVCIYSVVGLK